jgi:hypothetical protein
MISSGPRIGLRVSTWAWVRGLRLAVAAWNSGAPGAGTAYVWYSWWASSSPTALANAYRNCSKVSGTARCRLAGLASTGKLARSEDSGSGSTPRNGAASTATVAADCPRPATICAISPPNEWPITAGLRVSVPITPQ